MTKTMWVKTQIWHSSLMVCMLLVALQAYAQPKPPIPAFDVQFEEVAVNSAICMGYTMATGSQVCVPAQAFVDAKGKLVQGDVTLRYREFHHQFDLLWAGIPMEINVSGKKGQLESDGMFEIQAVQNGQLLQLAPGKRIKVRLAGRHSGRAMQHYYLDGKNGWVQLSTPVAEVPAPPAEVAAETPAAWDEDPEYAESDFYEGDDRPTKYDWEAETNFRAQVYRDMELDRMGTHNCDQLLPETTLNITASYRIANNQQMLKNTGVMVVYRGLNTIYTFYPGYELRLLRDKPFFLLAFLPNKKVLLLTETDLAKVDLNALHGKAHTFDMTLIDKTLEKPLDLIAILNSR